MRIDGDPRTTRDRSSALTRRLLPALWMCSIPLLAALAAIVLWTDSFTIQGTDGIYPRYVIGVFFILALGSCVVELIAYSRSRPATDDEVELDGARGRGVTVSGCTIAIVAMVIAALLVGVIGYFPAMAIMCAGLMFAIGVRKIWLLIVGALAMVVPVYLIFGVLAGVRFPTGLWGF